MTLEEKLTKIAEDMPKVYEAGKSEGIEQGKQAEYDAFWDIIQGKGTRYNYERAFAGVADQSQTYGWTDDIYNPKYPITICNSYYDSEVYGNGIFHYNTNLTDTKVDIIANGKGLPSTFYRCYKLKTIKKIVLNHNVTNWSTTFANCSKLENITIECGSIGDTVGGIDGAFNVQWSPLTHDSLMSIINALTDKSGDTSGTVWKVTIGDANIAKLTDEELNIAYKKGWTVA